MVVIKTCDTEIRQVLHDNLTQLYSEDPSMVIVHELQVCQGEARVDIALVNGKFHGFEIKSDKDTLERLPKQMSVYSRVFDTITLVTGESHFEEAINYLPNWWGISVAIGVEGKEVKVLEVRLPEENPETNIDCFSLAQFLWKNELVDLLSLKNIMKVSRLPRFKLWALVVEYCSTQEIKDYVRHCLKKRNG